jgi:hypothetical protein
MRHVSLNTFTRRRPSRHPFSSSKTPTERAVQGTVRLVWLVCLALALTGTLRGGGSAGLTATRSG